MSRANAIHYSAIEDGLLLANQPWAWMRLGTHTYELLAENERRRQATQLLSGLANLREGECHLLVVPRIWSPQRWRTDLDQSAPAPQDGWRPYATALTTHLAKRRLMEREVYLGVKLDAARSPRSGARGAVRSAYELFGVAGPSPDGWDLAALRIRVDQIRRALRGAGLAAEEATAAEIAWLIQRGVWRGIADPEPAPRELTYHGSLETLVDCAIDNRSRRHLVLNQRVGEEERSGYMATLALAGTPDRLSFPGGEWLYLLDGLPWPVDASIRFRLVPPREAAKHVDDRIAAARDQAANIAQAGAPLPLGVAEGARAAQELELALEKSRLPLVYAWPRWVVAAATEVEMWERVESLTAIYANMGFRLACPTGDQLALFYESFPGGRTRVSAYEQKMAVATLAGAMPHATDALGDGHGPYIGGAGVIGGRAPVLFDPLEAAAVNRSPAIAITGAPGNGKTTLASLLTYQLRLRGVWTVLLDPKGEANGLADLPGLGRVETIRLDHSYRGALDPWVIEPDPGRAQTVAADMCRYLLPVRHWQEAEGDVLAAAGVIASEPEPSLHKVVEHLKASDQPAARAAGSVLASLTRYPLAELCFAEGGRQPLDLADALTVVQFDSLVPPDARLAPSDWEVTDRLAMGLLHGIAILAGRLMTLTSQPRALVIDEAHVLTRSSAGQALIDRVASMARSKDLAMILITQRASDLLAARVDANIGARFAFGLENTAGDAAGGSEVDATLKFLGLPDTAETRAVLTSLGNGECLFRDLDRRVGRLQVDLVFPYLADAFDTTPRRRQEVSA